MMEAITMVNAFASATPMIIPLKQDDKCKAQGDQIIKKMTNSRAKEPLLDRAAHEFKRPTTVVKNCKTSHLL